MYAFCTFPLTLPFLRLPAAKTYRSVCRTIGTRLCPLCASLPVLVLSFPRLPASSPQFPASRTVRMIYNQQYSLTVSSCRARLLHELDASRPAPACPDPVGGPLGVCLSLFGYLAGELRPGQKQSLPRSTNHGSPARPPQQELPQSAFNFFFFNLLRTLAAQWTPATLFLSSASGLFPSPWGCIPPYPERFSRRATPRSEPVAVPLRLQQIRFYLLFVYAVTDPFFHNEGGTPLLQSRRPNETPFHPPR
jgi:hypothetical protein